MRPARPLQAGNWQGGPVALQAGGAALHLTFTPAGPAPPSATERAGPLGGTGPPLLLAAMHRHVDVDPDPDRSGIYRLWLRVTADAIESLVGGRTYKHISEEFVFGDNPFFEAVCENWGIRPERARERIRKIMEDRK